MILLAYILNEFSNTGRDYLFLLSMLNIALHCRTYPTRLMTLSDKVSDKIK